VSSGLFSDQDKTLIAARGSTEAAIRAQIEMLQKGFQFTKLQRPCTLDDGITVITPEAATRLAALCAEAVHHGRAMRFVPASGAATRMFRLLLTLPHPGEPDHQDFLHFFQNLRRFAFYDDLQAAMSRHGLRLESLVEHGQYEEVLDYLLTPKGLDYANLPKALLKFHRYPDHCRTPLEEHLVEGAATLQDRNRTARLHFTVPDDYQETVKQYLDRVRHRYEQGGVHYEITLSVQKPASDTIAVDLENRPFRDRQGHLLFRPAGHGALLANLHALQGDIVFLKNIDNVVPDHLKQETEVVTRLLGGYLVALQQEIFGYLQQIARQQIDTQLLQRIFAFARHKLCIVAPPRIEYRSEREQADFLWQKLNRPLRVCGVVKNTGEPGGGPFWVEHEDGTASLQIVETSQVDTQDAEQRAILAASTHFNPVNLVCGVRDYRGRVFDLQRFLDPNSGFVSIKSYEGRSLKALELPGLWNGAMAHWNTVFVEVPLLTFNPVKTVLDLLRPEHQPREA
jgi:Domain of unknown function (DUF4301)